MGFDELVDSAQRVLTRTLASTRTITYTSSQALGSVDLTRRALFRPRAPRVATLAGGENEVQGEVVLLGVALFDLPGGVANRGDTVVVSGTDGGTFRVANKIEDGEGTPDLELEEV